MSKIGTALLNFERRSHGKVVKLDIRDVNCKRIRLLLDGCSSICNFEVNQFVPYGDCLHISSPMIEAAQQVESCFH